MVNNATAAAAPSPAPVKAAAVRPPLKRDWRKRRRLRLPHTRPPAEVLLKKAVSLYEQGKLDEALQDIKKAVLIQPHYPEAYFYGGLARYKQGIRSGQDKFFQGLRMSRRPVGPFLSGKVYGAEKYYKGAISELTTFLQNAPEGETKKEAVTLLAEYKKLTGDTSGPVNAAGADGPCSGRRRSMNPRSRNRI